MRHLPRRRRRLGPRTYGPSDAGALPATATTRPVERQRQTHRSLASARPAPSRGALDCQLAADGAATPPVAERPAAHRPGRLGMRPPVTPALSRAPS